MAVECPSRDTLQAFLAEQLVADELAFVDEHVGECDACQSVLDEIVAAPSVIPRPTTTVWAKAASEDSATLREVMVRMKSLPMFPPPPAAGLSSVSLHSLAIVQPTEDPRFQGQIGKYGITEIIGYGGMGIVLQALDTALDRIVAIKTLLPVPPPGPEVKSRFMREARSAAALRHDHVVTIHAVDESNGMPFIVMEFIRGQSLLERIAHQGRLSVAEVRRYGAQAARALAAAHAKGLIHRDIKPANLIIDEETSRLKITDFGLAKAGDDASLTQSGALAGTPEYMAPEQARGAAVDHTADLFSLGTVLYTALTGISPFAADSALGALRKVCEDAPHRIQTLNPSVPDDLAKTIEQLMAKDPRRRIRTAIEAAERLDTSERSPLERADGTGSPEPSRPFPGRKKWAIVAAVATLAIVLTVGVILYLSPLRSIGPEPKRGFRLAGAEHVYPTLAAAVSAARSGDVIDVFGSETFVTEPVSIQSKALTVRAAPGHQPVLSMAVSSDAQIAPAITTNASLILEGLEINWLVSPRSPDEDDVDGKRCAVLCESATLKALNCRFRVARRNACIGLLDASGEFLNCEFSADNGMGCVWSPSRNRYLRLENSLVNSRAAIITMIGPASAPKSHARFDAIGSTFETTIGFRWLSDAGVRQQIVCRTENCFFDVEFLHVPAAISAAGGPLQRRDVRRMIQSVIDASEQHNVYSQSCQFLGLAFRTRPPQAPPTGNVNLDSWLSMWQQENAGSRQLESEEQPPADVGADRTKIGPGPAYQAVRKSPDYQNWTREPR